MQLRRGAQSRLSTLGSRRLARRHATRELRRRSTHRTHQAQLRRLMPLGPPSDTTTRRQAFTPRLSGGCPNPSRSVRTWVLGGLRLAQRTRASSAGTYAIELLMRSASRLAAICAACSATLSPPSLPSAFSWVASQATRVPGNSLLPVSTPSSHTTQRALPMLPICPLAKGLHHMGLSSPLTPQQSHTWQDAPSARQSLALSPTCAYASLSKEGFAAPSPSSIGSRLKACSQPSVNMQRRFMS
mmetsp:Transcript_20937/g.68555  ORF Transcript_20937/g.68555 Transcript_20937/m.68555 type:complete len:243 (-) Transcript_20937:1016-1744(-)